jgi:alpha-1,3-glucosyltransferase
MAILKHNGTVGDWYLNYWGLDYPPLTAYTSIMYGKVFEKAYPALVKWKTSEAPIRPGEILNEVQKPKLENDEENEKWRFTYFMHILQLILLLVLPSLILIDHGHFQYNGVCIGLTLLACNFIN